VGTVPLVGREEPLRRLTRLLEESLAGLGRLVFVSGEPGVGKSRLALEVLDLARDRGARTAVGVCWDGAGTPGLWPWVQVLRTLRAAVGDEGWQRDGGDDEALSLLLGSDQASAPAEFHVFESMLQLLTHLCDERPVALLVEDLQWADAGSVTLLDFLHHHAGHLPLLVVATYRADELARSDHPRALAVADLAQTATTIPLTGLDNDGIRQVREHLGTPTTTAESEQLRRLTGGNPFFVIESVAFNDPTESLGVRRAIDRRVDALGDREQRVLGIASLIGREAPDALVNAVVGVDTADAFVAIEQSGLMRREAGAHAFVHDLVREALASRLAPDERRERYAAIVRAADEEPGGSSLLPAQVAWLATQAVPDLPAERAVSLLVAAAADETSRLTHEAAGGHLAEAATLTPDPQERARLTLESGNAYQRAGALALARDRYEELLGVGSVEIRANALLGLHRLGDPAAGAQESAVVAGLDAVDAELAGSVDKALRARVMAARSQARTHLLADDRSDAVDLGRRALELARSADDLPTVASCLLAYHDAIWEPGTELERREVSDEMAALGHRIGDPAIEGQGLLLRMVAEIEVGDPAYRVTHDQFQGVAERSRSPRLQFVAASRRGTMATLHADLPRALAEVDAAKALGERIGEPDAISVWCDQRWQIARNRGELDVIDDLMATLRELGDPHWTLYEALVAVDTGDPDRARRYLPDIAALGERWPRWAARLWDTMHVELAILDQDLARIGELADRLEADAGQWAVLGGGVLVYGPMTVWLGRLEAARGNWERALSWSTRAEAEAGRLEMTLWEMEAQADRLTAQQVLGSSDASEIAASLAAADERGLAKIVERLSPLAPVTPSRPVAPAVFRRDEDVWTLVFDGVEARMPDAKGLRDLQRLVAQANVELPATSLATDGFVSAGTTPMLDAQAKLAYRHRLDQIDGELDRASLRGDRDRAARLEEEREALLDELRRATGLGGRVRQVDDERERMRKTVTARIRDTLRRLDDRHPPLAAHLRASVRTGAICVYAPAEPVTWDLG
jgi:hypothetical protein